MIMKKRLSLKKRKIDSTETSKVIGIVPDIEIKPTIEGLKNDKDELLEKAIELINE